MNSNLVTRRNFTVRLASLLPALGAAGTALASVAIPRAQKPDASGEITHTNEAIHQKVIQLSAAVKSGMVPPGKPAEIIREPGGAFALFGGYISGRQLVLVPDKLIVQAWRAGSWDPDSYSIAKFALSDQDAGTKLIFDHTGFPNGEGSHLAEGWHINYWEPLAKSLA
jgi:Activator of Hsp90 ATPase homolog 1-like protein